MRKEIKTKYKYVKATLSQVISDDASYTNQKNDKPNYILVLYISQY